MAVVLVLAGCTSTVVTGTGRVAVASVTLPAGDSLVQRQVVDTRVGDPVTADFCTAVPFALQAGGYTVHAHSGQELAGCSFDVVPDTVQLPHAPSFDVYVVVRDAAAFEAAPHGSAGSLHGQRTWSLLYRDESCSAFVLLAPYYLETYSRIREDDGVPSKHRACAVVHAVTDRMAAAIAGGRLPRRELSHRTVATIEFCKTLTDTEAARLVGGYAFRSPFDAGSGCRWSQRGNELSVFVRTVNSGYDPFGKPSRAGGHRLLDYPDTDPALGCNAVSDQGQIPALGKMEIVIVRLESQVGHGSLCPQAEQAAVEVLDGAGLK